MSAVSQPLVSVVTPVHDTAEFLAACIESVLAQTYEHFEYIIVENQSTDGSGDIADRYAAADDRIRVVRTPALLPQVRNYNFALAQISPSSTYTKMCQADDWLFPRCLEDMVALGEAQPTTGIISSYYLRETDVMNTGLPPDASVLTDGAACRLHLQDGLFLFGSPTTVMYRSQLVRDRVPFYDEGRLHEDTELCFDVLDKVDFGFVHQVLSFSRAQADSITAAAGDFLPEALDRVIVVKRFGRRYLDAEQYEVVEQQARTAYYHSLARRLVRGLIHRVDPSFWEHQRRGLASVDERIDRRRLARALLHVAVEGALSPLEVVRAMRRVRHRGPTASGGVDA